MKIAIFVENMLTGGVQRLIADDANELSRRGHDVFVLTFKDEDPKNTMRNEIELPQDRFFCIPFASAHDLRGWKNLFRFFKRERPDAVITHMWMANNIARIAAFLSGVPRILSFEHSVYDDVKSRKQFVIDRVLQYFSTAIVAVSVAVKKSLVQHGISSKNISVLANGIDLKRYDPRKYSKHVGSEFVFVFIGRLVDAKGADILLDAFAKISGAVLLIAGDGPLREKLEKQAESLKIKARVSFLGSVSDVPALLSRADCLVLPSRREGFGIALLEALAMGVPVIVSGEPGMQEVVTNGYNGIIVEEAGAEALSRAMKEIMLNENLRVQLSENGRKSGSKFSIEAHVDELLRLCENSLRPPIFTLMKYIASGTIAAAVQLGLLYFFVEYFRLQYILAASAAFVFSFAASFTLQKFWTFGDSDASKLHWQIPAQLALVAVNLTLNAFIMYALVEGLGIGYLFAQFLAAAFISLETFFALRIIFKPK